MAERPRAIIVDLDGTLANMGERFPHDYMACGNDLPHEHIARLVRVYAAAERVRVLVVSGRRERCRRITEFWLADHGIPCDRLYMRTDKDNREDDTFKREVYVTTIQPNYKIDFVLDDRDRVVRMWREQGLPCLQVAPGDF